MQLQEVIVMTVAGGIKGGAMLPWPQTLWEDTDAGGNGLAYVVDAHAGTAKGYRTHYCWPLTGLTTVKALFIKKVEFHSIALQWRIQLFRFVVGKPHANREPSKDSSVDTEVRLGLVSWAGPPPLPAPGPPRQRRLLRNSFRGPGTPGWASPALGWWSLVHLPRGPGRGSLVPRVTNNFLPSLARRGWLRDRGRRRLLSPGPPPPPAPCTSVSGSRRWFPLSGVHPGVPDLGSAGEMPLGHIMRLDLEKIALEYIVPCLHEVGFCYLDNFLGEVVGDCVLERVKQLHYNGVLRDGQLAGPRAGVSKRHLRGDQITWIGGNEEGCEAINFLLSLIDRLVLYCGSRLGKYYVKERSKCPQLHGGILRIFPEGKSFIADVEPIFDRLLFFWSDRRNPHEVQPSYATRYAMTVWYFDAEERAEAKKKFRSLTRKTESALAKD
ncbi:PREDICTED: LOW QUALITY PROTEIN: egl nine homolog 3 [Dipodomys ordii]|uniref:LOW QUALITY PROTEIN: egl nine homolog 3 n=1 Tax=Dipodomys ordii TaxID=10020 RepID=A0A1S3ETF0_DIPOR|nr:PREDICTED: LOW QUALITY PROTEIN: egl nine homolog 3 [Dipodomys ordii]